MKLQPPVRLLDRSDLPEVAQLARLIWHRHYPGIISLDQIEYMLAKMYSLAVMENEIEAQGVVYLGIGARGALLGFASAGPHPDPGVFKLHKLYVNPDHQRQGYGRALLEAVTGVAAARRAVRLSLCVNKRNVSALKAYERYGFVRQCETCVSIGGGYMMDDFVLEKSLPPAPHPL